MKYKINREKIRNFMSLVHLRKLTFLFLAEWSKTIIFILAIIVCIYCVYIWQVYIYAPRWSEERVNHYSENKEKGTSLNKADFEKIADDHEARKIRSQEAFENPRDIFRLKK